MIDRGGSRPFGSFLGVWNLTREEEGGGSGEDRHRKKLNLVSGIVSSTQKNILPGGRKRVSLR